MTTRLIQLCSRLDRYDDDDIDDQEDDNDDDDIITIIAITTVVYDCYHHCSFMCYASSIF